MLHFSLPAEVSPLRDATKSSVKSPAAAPGRLLIPADAVSEGGPRQVTQEEEERLCLDEYCHCPSSLKRACPLRRGARKRRGSSPGSGEAFRISPRCGELGLFSQPSLERRSEGSPSICCLPSRPCRRRGEGTVKSRAKALCEPATPCTACCTW